jgi:hypothetical protein
LIGGVSLCSWISLIRLITSRGICWISICWCRGICWISLVRGVSLRSCVGWISLIRLITSRGICWISLVRLVLRLSCVHGVCGIRWLHVVVVVAALCC